MDEELMKLGKPSMTLMHPLPRINEITVGVDADPRAKYFDQVKCGMFMRMAILASALGRI
jgi:aspartate carbamoyltransferase catalytic subunit